MYKRASRVLQHAHRVDRIDPSKGFVWRDEEMDLLPSASNMGLGMCRDELRQSAIEMTKLEQALAIAKRQKDKDQVTFLGQQKAALCMRRAPVKARQRELVAEHDGPLYVDAINAIMDEVTAKRVFEHVKNAKHKLIDSAMDDTL